MIAILEDLVLSGWIPQPIDMPRHQHQACPACSAAIQPLTSINTHRGTMTVAECCSCGWLGYADPPSAAWWAEFYSRQWDQHGKTAQFDPLRMHVHPTVGWLMREFPDPQRQPRVLDFGCGFGVALSQLRREGYQNLYGVETCQHRREYARDQQGLDVRSSLADFAGMKFDAIALHHVLEHCLEPAPLCLQFSQLLEPHGLLHIDVPDQAAEPTMGVLMFLPHVHSFTSHSLVELCHGAGVAVREVFEANGDLVCTATQTDLWPTPNTVPAQTWHQLHAAKMDRAIGPGLLVPFGLGRKFPILVWSGYRETPQAWSETDQAQIELALRFAYQPRAAKFVCDHSTSTGAVPYALIAPHLYVK